MYTYRYGVFIRYYTQSNHFYKEIEFHTEGRDDLHNLIIVSTLEVCIQNV